MSIALVSTQELKLSQLYVAQKTPDSHFYTQFKAAYADYAYGQAKAETGISPAIVTSQEDNTSVMGDVYSEMARRRGTSEQDTAAYAAILNAAYSGTGISDPQAYLKSLSAQQLSVVQHVHGLAERIQVNTLSKEGATNLLLPDGYSVDLNHNHQEEIGAAITMHFPTRDAPMEFQQAWASTIDGMDEADVMTYSMLMHACLFGMAIAGEQIPPGDLPPSDQLGTYQDIVQNALAMLDKMRPDMTPQQYEKDLFFYSRLQGFLGQYALPP